MRMPSTPAYDLVKDDQDLRIPLHAEQAFFHGITFQAKLIGWREVPRPNSRSEIVQAMRRIRYECKVQNSKKQKVTIHISVDGVKVLLKKKKRKKKQQWPNDGSDTLELMHHPIYRIFYVSHDNSDLKIFSYIARDGSTDTFKCSVFKSNKKSQAMRIVRTVGQAFEVCHKFNLQKNSQDADGDQHHSAAAAGEQSDSLCELSDRRSDQNSDADDPAQDLLLSELTGTGDTQQSQPMKRPNHLDISPPSTGAYNFRKSHMDLDDRCLEQQPKQQPAASPEQPRTPTYADMQQMRESLDAQTMQTRQALAQLVMLRDQLITETNARIEAQARTQQLLQQNRELLEHLASFGGYADNDRPGLTAATIGLAPQLSSTAKVAAWFQQLNATAGASLSRPESGFVSGDSRSERNPEDPAWQRGGRGSGSGRGRARVSALLGIGGAGIDEGDGCGGVGAAKDADGELCDEYLLVEGTANLWSKLSAKKRRKLLSLRLGKVTTF